MIMWLMWQENIVHFRIYLLTIKYDFSLNKVLIFSLIIVRKVVDKFRYCV